MGNNGKIAKAKTHREEILARVAKGEYLASIAKDLGLSGKGQGISNYLAQDPEYQQARELGLAAKLADRERELECAEPEYVPRARELLSHARWRAEREAPHLWGQHNRLTVEHSGDLGDRLRRAKERVIDGAAQVVSDDAGQQNALSLNNQGEDG
jgi:hypothetical protein